MGQGASCGMDKGYLRLALKTIMESKCHGLALIWFVFIFS